MNEEIQVWGFIAIIISNVIALAIGFYKFNEHIKSDIDAKVGRVYKRMDEKASAFEKIFVRQDVHDIELRNLAEKSDTRAENLMKHVDLRLDGVISSIKDLSDRFNHKGD